MVTIPEDVKKYLVKDEVIDKQFKLGAQIVFTSANRMFIKEGKTVRDINFAHISSIEWQVKRKWFLIIIGIVLIVGIFCLGQLNPPDWAFMYPESRVLFSYGELGRAFYYISGIILIILGYRWKMQSVNISVAGLSEKQIFKVFKSNKNTLDALFRLVNERRLQVKPNQTQRSSI